MSGGAPILCPVDECEGWLEDFEPAGDYQERRGIHLSGAGERGYVGFCAMCQTHAWVDQPVAFDKSEDVVEVARE